ILINDMAAWYVARNQLPVGPEQLPESVRSNFPVPQGFSLGSMAGFYTYAELLAHLDTMAAQYPHLITARQPASTTIETIQGRTVYKLKISDNPNISEAHEPKVLFTSMIHAREPGTMMHLVFMMYYLLENYGTDPVVTYLVDNVELYYVPMVNPDGYLFNQQTNPNGGGMWRKNRRPNAGGSFGVDLNRNFGYMWGFDNIGSSPTPTSETFRGTGPFSEPETQILRDLCLAIPFSTALNYHSFSNLLLYPWGYIPETTPDDYTFETWASHMTADNNYLYGPTNITIYPVNGGSDDWMYGEQFTKDKIFAFTPEIGTSFDGFWPPIHRIIPHCQENMLQSMLAGLVTLHYGILKPTGTSIISTTNDSITFDLQRIGMKDAGNFTVSLTPLSPWVIESGDPITYSNMEFLQTISGSIPITLYENIPDGTSLKFVLSLNNGFYTSSDTITRVFGTPHIVFSDNCTNLNQWTGTWGTTTATFVSPPASITDSPAGNYSNNANSSITTAQQIDLSNAVFAKLNFWAKWEIETGWDYVQVRVSNNNGATWTALPGRYTKPGNANQAFGQPLYDGVQTTWVYEEIDLSAFLGQQIRIRFTLRSDGWDTDDGFYFDDVKVTTIHATPGITAFFYSDQTLVLEGTNIQFNDYSAGSPNSWKWSIAGGIPASSTAQHPMVLFNEAGQFNVQLVASNVTYSDTIIRENYIVVLDSILCRPVVFAGPDATTPENQPLLLTFATAENHSQIIWTTSGDGVFSNNNHLNPSYTPGAEDIANQSVTLTLTGIAIYDICENTSDDMVLSITDPVGICQPVTERFAIYPNPFQNELKIVNQTSEAIRLIELFDLNGRLVHSHVPASPGEYAIALTNMPDREGVFVVKITTDTGTYVTKVIRTR
ncbi:MAG TPA: M14 family zinc carboxypeptidase, partial [Bacteroidales bacterium]|nr:M14 family zinc carboxypeptidase [Bacteroidales bacterium]